MTERRKVVCPDCGVDMNCHARKVDYTSLSSDPGADEAEFGGALEEFYTCPECGRTDARAAG